MKQLFYILIALVAMLVSATSTSLAQEHIATQAVWVEEPYLLTNNSATQTADYLQVFAVDESAQALFGRFWNLSADQTFEYSGFGWVSQEDTQQIEPPSVSTRVTIGGSQENMSSVQIERGVLPEIPEQVDCEIQEPSPFLVEIQIQTSWVVDTIVNCNMFLRNYDGTRFWVIRDFDTLFETTHGFFMLENEEDVFGWSYPLDTVVGDGTCNNLTDVICSHISDAMGSIMSVLNTQLPVTVHYGEIRNEIPPVSVYTPEACTTIDSPLFALSEEFVGEIGCQNVLMWLEDGETVYQLVLYFGTIPYPENSRVYKVWSFLPTATSAFIKDEITKYLISNDFHGIIYTRGINDMHPELSY